MISVLSVFEIFGAGKRFFSLLPIERMHQSDRMEDKEERNVWFACIFHYFLFHVHHSFLHVFPIILARSVCIIERVSHVPSTSQLHQMRREKNIIATVMNKHVVVVVTLFVWLCSEREAIAELWHWSYWISRTMSKDEKHREFIDQSTVSNDEEHRTDDDYYYGRWE